MSKYDKKAQDWVNHPHAWQDHEDDHVAEQYINMWDRWFKVLISISAMVVFAIVLYAIVIDWLNYYL